MRWRGHGVAIVEGHGWRGWGAPNSRARLAGIPLTIFCEKSKVWVYSQAKLYWLVYRHADQIALVIEPAVLILPICELVVLS